MKKILPLFLLSVVCWLPLQGQHLPVVFDESKNNDLVGANLKIKAAKAFNMLQVTNDPAKWIEQRDGLREEIAGKANVKFYPELPLEYNETGKIKREGYEIKNIFFQTSPGVYATANLYIPDGKGPFPAVVVMMGHSRSGKLDDTYQSLGHTLALNGYVSLNIDPWGAGERSTRHGEYEYHGSNLGASLMNVGETLMGVQITDNMRAVDLLCSLPFVDTTNIGATGASGGGNQTMWLAAMDERVKAAVPVVSVGTFQSYILNSNCICEALPGGLTLTEEGSVLGLVAPRALKICNALGDSNPAFSPHEMLRSFQGARVIYRGYEADDKLAYQLFDTTHGYFPEMREAMIGWFDLHLKKQGTGSPKKEKPFSILPPTDLMVFPVGERSGKVVTTEDFCFIQGNRLREEMLLRRNMDSVQKKSELERILQLPEGSRLANARQLPDSDDWERYILETTTGELIPALIYSPNKNSSQYVLIVGAEGKESLSEKMIAAHAKNKLGICIVDLWGIGENASSNAGRIDGALPDFHTLSRSALWFGATTQGIWINQLDIVSDWLVESFKIKSLAIEANKEPAVGALLFSALRGKVGKLILNDMPFSYLFDKSGNIDYFSMAMHIPGFLVWGDITLAAALSGAEITWVDPVSISGRILDRGDIAAYKDEIDHFDTLAGKRSKINIIQTK